jgi:ABC-type multidrug transport system ATPase subunit
MSAIEFRSVDKIYRGRRVIDSVSFMIEGGERIVLFVNTNLAGIGRNQPGDKQQCCRFAAA